MNNLQTRLHQITFWSSIAVVFASVAVLAGHVYHITPLFLTSETSGTSVQTALLILSAALIITIDRVLRDIDVLKLKFTASCVMLVYIGTMLFDHDIRTGVDKFLLGLVSTEYPIKTSNNTLVGILFLMLSSASYAVNNRVLAISTAFIAFVFPLLLMLDSILWDAEVLGGMSLQTGFLLATLGACVFTKRLLMEPFTSQIERFGMKAEVVRISILGMILAIVSLIAASVLSSALDHIIPLLVVCFVYQHILFNNSTRAATHLRTIEMSKEQLYTEVVTDKLTKVGNRMSIKRILAEYSSIGVRKIGVMLFDIDFFKLVNDRYGHEVGDNVLYKMCRRVEKELRQTDRLVRWGGEEFMVIVPTDDFHELHTVAENVRKCIEQNEIAGINITISSGITVGDTIHFDELVNKADKGLYNSKETGRNRTTVVDADFILYGTETGQFITLVEVEEALINKDFFFEYQPIFDGVTKDIVGIEALMRWDKQGTIIYPDYFADKLNSVMLAKPENTERMFNMMSDAIEDLADIHPDAYISFNIHITILSDFEHVTQLLKTLDISNKFNRKIMVEILESTDRHTTNEADVIQSILRIRREGHRVALDDFGVEDSNLVRLISLPVDTIKIDKAITRMINSDDPLLERAIKLLNGMSESFLDMGVKSVIIEGVETQFQVTELSQLGINTHQGWYYSKAGDKHQLQTISVPFNNLLKP